MITAYRYEVSVHDLVIDQQITFYFAAKSDTDAGNLVKRIMHQDHWADESSVKIHQLSEVHRYEEG